MCRITAPPINSVAGSDLSWLQQLPEFPLNHDHESSTWCIPVLPSLLGPQLSIDDPFLDIAASLLLSLDADHDIGGHSGQLGHMSVTDMMDTPITTPLRGLGITRPVQGTTSITEVLNRRQQALISENVGPNGPHGHSSSADPSIEREQADNCDDKQVLEVAARERLGPAEPLI
eukprot:CAMPEP_0202892394 /NCGR_PEP_ID=MMETSP1392-20130828/2120_1 /ASSEMBLY_ACC=CAM_ASM_000868 /TAXON_ID=225041 /ORGANISM="Chlamydomonas chlamydogama, Strain SAG 11-48b" /LENGTH=173 /DNA_ID=CAMNT_0049576327 /DNA_START=78 /DNA_END=599 /DNA_ORIENTATION=-